MKKKSFLQKFHKTAPSLPENGGKGQGELVL